MSAAMTPYQALLAIIVERAREDGFVFDGDASTITADNVEDLYGELEEEGAQHDYESQLREGEEETGLPCEWSRHYESKSVAAKAPNGLWIGWTYWYGGGKHGEPESIDWMNSAYFLNVTEEEKMVVVRTFTKAEEAAAC